jgi:hypothetical protein
MDEKARIEKIERVLFGGTIGEEDGLCKKVKEMHEDFVFFSRVYKVFMFFVSVIFITLIGIILNLLFKSKVL